MKWAVMSNETLPLVKPEVNQYALMAGAVDFIRSEVSTDLEAQGLSIILNVMWLSPQPMLIAELQELVGISHGSVARYLRVLGDSDDHPRGGACANILHVYTDVTDARRRLVMLAPKGVEMRKELGRILEGLK